MSDCNLPCDQPDQGTASQSPDATSTTNSFDDSVAEPCCSRVLDENSDSIDLPEAQEAKWVSFADGIHQLLEWKAMCNAGEVGPRRLLQEMCPSMELSEDITDRQAWHLIVALLTEPEPRQKLLQYNTLADAVDLIRERKKILVLTGAGISVSCGIPDFRSRDGIYARLRIEYPELPDPQAIFDIQYFRNNPKPFFKFAKEIYPGLFAPSLSHKFIAQLEKTGKLLRNYTQNIDCLEIAAGVSKFVQCHGSFSTATCCACGHKATCEDIRDAVMNQEVPKCPRCPPDTTFSVLKPDIVFFGENLSDAFHDQITLDKDEVDLLIVIGSSLKVRPVALIPFSLPHHVPQILINRDPLPHHTFDICLFGSCDNILLELCYRLGTEPWSSLVPTDYKGLRETTDYPKPPVVPFVKNVEEDLVAPVAKKCKQALDDSTKDLKEFGDVQCPVNETAASAVVNDCIPDSNSDQQEESPQLNDIISRNNIADSLEEGTYLFIEPCNYVFRGAEMYQGTDSSSDDDSVNSDEEEEEDDEAPEINPSFVFDPNELITSGSMSEHTDS